MCNAASTRQKRSMNLHALATCSGCTALTAWTEKLEGVSSCPLGAREQSAQTTQPGAWQPMKAGCSELVTAGAPTPMIAKRTRADAPTPCEFRRRQKEVALSSPHTHPTPEIDAPPASIYVCESASSLPPLGQHLVCTESLRDRAELQGSGVAALVRQKPRVRCATYARTPPQQQRSQAQHRGHTRRRPGGRGVTRRRRSEGGAKVWVIGSCFGLGWGS